MLARVFVCILLRFTLSNSYKHLEPPTNVKARAHSLNTKVEVTWRPLGELSSYKVVATCKPGVEVWMKTVEPSTESVLIDGLDPVVMKAGGYTFAVTAVDQSGGKFYSLSPTTMLWELGTDARD